MAVNKPSKDLDANRWESRALDNIYAAIFLISVAFTFIMFQAARIIGESNPSIDPILYFQTHFGTLIVEIFLWIIIARAAVRLKAYTRNLKHSKDGRALDFIANAYLLVLLFAILFGMASTVKTLFWHSPYLDLAINITNLLPVAIVLAATILLFRGSNLLIGMLPSGYDIFGSWKRFILLITVLFATSSFAAYMYNTADTILDDDGLNHFALPPVVLIFVYILPYVAVWMFGLFSCLNIAHYAKNIKGVVYRRLFHKLNKGLIISFIGLFLVQVFYLSNLPSNQIGPGLLFLIGVLGILIYGSFLVYRGAGELAKIED